MKALCVGDIHAADRPPSLRTDTYTEDILDKLRQTVEIANSNGVDYTIWVGDVFHNKTPSRVSHELVQSIMEICHAYESALYIVPGNHDIRHDRLDTMGQQPLGTLFRSRAAIELSGLGCDGTAFGIPYLRNWQDLPKWCQTWRESGEPRLVVIHGPIMPPGVSVPYEYIDSTDIEQMWTNVRSSPEVDVGFYYGHIHDCHGAYAVGMTAFCNNGAISRASLHESDLSRIPAVTLYDSEKLLQTKFQRIELKVKPIREVMRVAEHEEEEAKQERLDEFLERVAATELDDFSIEAVLQLVEGMELDELTKRIIIECLEGAMK